MCAFLIPGIQFCKFSSEVTERIRYLRVNPQEKSSIATITGYRTAIIDALSSYGELIAKILELNRLIASFCQG